MVHSEPQPDVLEPPDAFAFGKNWTRFLKAVDDERIAAAADSLTRMLGEDELAGKRFLDAGCGSGLFSLAAWRLGAQVASFDVDPQSVACAEEMRRRFAPPDVEWRIQTGSLLDPDFLEGLGDFDVVYSWGVVHHTGSMWVAIDNLRQRVVPGGVLWLAVYNDQGLKSRVWTGVKRLYNRLPSGVQPLYVVLVGGTWSAWRLAARLATTAAAMVWRLVSLRNPFAPAGRMYRDVFQRQRGMHWWYDLVDWIGGWPFEVAKPEEVFRSLRDHGFDLVELKTCCGGLGCNEFLFRRRS